MTPSDVPVPQLKQVLIPSPWGFIAAGAARLHLDVKCLQSKGRAPFPICLVRKENIPQANLCHCTGNLTFPLLLFLLQPLISWSPQYFCSPSCLRLILVREELGCDHRLLLLSHWAAALLWNECFVILWAFSCLFQPSSFKCFLCLRTYLKEKKKIKVREGSWS